MCRTPSLLRQEVVTWPSGCAARQFAALPNRHGSLRRRTSPEPQTRIAWSRCRLMPAKCPDLSQWAEEDFRDAEAIAEAVQRPTMKFVASTTEQLDLSVTGRTLRLDQEPEASRVGARDGTVRSSGWNREV